jgi:hypothetical protein
VLALARPTPRRRGWPCALWPLARWPQALHARHGRHVTPATRWKGLHAEGLVGKRQQRWCPVTVEAACVATRGPSSRPPPSRSRRGGSAAALRRFDGIAEVIAASVQATVDGNAPREPSVGKKAA